MSVGKSIITVDGINALANASASGSSVKPKYFKFSNQDLVLDPNLSASDLTGWRTQNINLYQIVDNQTVEFVCDVEPTEASDYTRSVGLFLEDGTLFMVAKPPFAFPPMLRQTFKIQMVYQNATELLDFKYVAFSQTEQDLSLLNTNVVLGLQLLEIKQDLANEKEKTAAMYEKQLADKDEVINKLNDDVENTKLLILDSNAILGNEILATKRVAEKIKL
ncbi:phage tail-collar fiber domain-containing protein [Poseidonibacter lekithochrous]|uniref:phage tail-collar fiber domain-containing protein n=1 Tax=Poseidonibacter lekithochrous TaxID=1904463 RepID=UPI000D3A00E2|nr:phage tail protein [Poseidonibacter lekithochrous]